MESSDPAPAPPMDVHVPFTRAERMEQLADIDRDIASLLELTGGAIRSLGKQTPAPPAATSEGEHGQAARPLTAEEQTQAFQDNMEKFLSTLHSVNVRLKRQIWGLEEAGILKDKPKDEEGTAGPRPTLEPNGLGMIGTLDVGWLNSRSNQVEREMEAELWTKARKHLETVASMSGPSAGGDVNPIN